MEPKPGGGRIEWPESGWPKHWAIVLAIVVVLITILLVFAIIGESSSEGAPLEDPAAQTPAGAPG
jgi:hypothetical protein